MIAMNDDNLRVALSFKNHSVVMQGIDARTVTSFVGKTTTNYTYKYMDPAYGKVINVRATKLSKALHRAFYIGR